MRKFSREGGGENDGEFGCFLKDYVFAYLIPLPAMSDFRNLWIIQWSVQKPRGPELRRNHEQGWRWSWRWYRRG